MHRRISRAFRSLLVAAVVLVGCNLPAAGGAGASLSLIEPADGAGYQVGDLVKVRSQVAAPEGAVEMVLLVNGAPARTDRLTLPLSDGTMLQPWQPVEPGSYTLQTRMTTASGAVLASNSVTIVVAASASELPTPTSTPTASPTSEAASPTPTPSPTLGPPIVTADQDANCRLGPAPAYTVTGALKAGASSPIVGRDTGSTWWVIRAAYGGGDCWIWDGVVTVGGDLSGVPVVDAPPLPPAAPVLISPSGSHSCTSSVLLKWNPVEHPNGIAHYQWEVQGPGGIDTGDTPGTSVEYIVACGSSAYKWRVRAVDNAGVAGSYSGFMNFEIQ